MRLFIAISVPKEIEEYLTKLQDKIRTLQVKATYPKEHHLTLLFLGETAESQIQQIKDQLSQIQFKSFSAEINNLGVFPNESYIKVIWAGIKDHHHITELAKDISQALDKQPGQRFHPHLTLARVKFTKDKQAIKQIIKEKPEPKGFKVRSFRLIKSTLTPDGPVYETIEEFTASQV